MEEKILKRGQPGYRDSDVKLIDREKITDDQGKEIQLKKPNIDKIQKANPFFIHGKAEEKAKSPNMKIKKRRIKLNRGDGSNLMSHSPSNLSMGSGIHENMMRVKVEQEIKELPGQVETFVGKPMFQKHYHQIVPTESRGDERDKNKKGPGITKRQLARMANDS